MGHPPHTHQGRDGVRGGERFQQHAAPCRSGRVLQALVGAQESFAVGTVVVHVLQGVHTEGDEAATRYAPQQAQAPTGEPGEGASVVGQLSHDHLVAGRTAHLDRTVEKGDRPLHVYGLHSNCGEQVGAIGEWGKHPSDNQEVGARYPPGGLAHPPLTRAKGGQRTDKHDGGWPDNGVSLGLRRTFCPVLQHSRTFGT